MAKQRLLSGLLLSLLAACEAPQNSKEKDEWNDANNPVTMMANAYSFETSYEALPKSGRPDRMPWSDNYWPSYQGGLGYRWNQEKTRQLSRMESRSSDSLYAGQLDEDPELQKLRSEVYGYVPYTKDQLLALSDEARQATIRGLSPAEKYDIYRGDFAYPTLQSERRRTGILLTLRDQPSYLQGKKIETWFGLCHAWAPATVMFQEPGALSIEGKDRMIVDFGASDIKALLTYMIDTDQSQTRFNSFMGVRCNSDLSPSNLARVEQEVFGDLQWKDNEKVEVAIQNLLDNMTIDVAIKMGLAAYVLAYADTLEYAQERFQAVSYELGRYVTSSLREDFRIALEKAPKILALAETGALTTAERWAGIQDAFRTKGCSDTNAGAFHLVLSNLVGLQKQSFMVDITRDREVWNQAVAGYSANELQIYSGDSISPLAAPGTVKEVEILSTFYYTGEMAPDFQPFSDGTRLDRRFHHPLRYSYRLELDADGHIIGGSWLSNQRPDFLWGAANFVFSPAFTDLKKLYYAAKRRP